MSESQSSQTEDKMIASPPLSLTEPPMTELIAQIKKPTTTPELLQNIKFIMDHDLLLREDFYTKEYIESFLGGETVEFSTNTRGNQLICDGRVSKLSSFVPSTPGISFSTDELELELIKINENGKVVCGWINLELAKPAWDIPYDVWRSILGAPDRPRGVRSLHINSDSPVERQPKTHVHGYESILYTSNIYDRERKISFTTYGDGAMMLSKFKIGYRLSAE